MRVASHCCAALVLVGALVAPAVADQARHDLLQVALKALRDGQTDRLVGLFHYFEDAVGQTEAAKDRAILRRFFSLLREHFGRPDQLGATRSTSPDFINLFMESARPDLWRNSDCLFKEYAFSGTFTRGGEHRQADVLLEVCVDNSRRPVWLRKVDVHFVNPDPETVGRAQALFRQLQEDIRRIRGPRT